MIIYVDASVIQTGNGTKENPFKTIQEAAAKALPGDEVIVAPGLYREAVNPIHAGTADKRITYRSAIKGQAHITGSEAVKDWESVEGTVWKAVIPNGIFGDYNPFTTLVSGDWFIATFIAHTGDVYLNEKSMYEVTTLDKVKNPQKVLSHGILISLYIHGMQNRMKPIIRQLFMQTFMKKIPIKKMLRSV